jgi:D-alanyl-D-alanine carboxypeptidase (penicillin-binding protein 5/6)
MTALVAEELVAEDSTFNVSSAAMAQLGESGFVPGEVLTSQSLRDYSLIASSNDAAYALADAIGDELLDGGKHAAFVEAMNITAEELALPSLKFKNATGLDESATVPGSVGSAADVSKLMAHILKKYQYILEPTTTAYDRVYNEAGAFHEAENTNPVIYRIPNLLGSKTGYTDLAGGNLTIAFDAGYNRPIVVTVLGSGYDERFSDVLTLVAAVQEAFSKIDKN